MPFMCRERNSDANLTTQTSLILFLLITRQQHVDGHERGRGLNQTLVTFKKLLPTLIRCICHTACTQTHTHVPHRISDPGVWADANANVLMAMLRRARPTCRCTSTPVSNKKNKTQKTLLFGTPTHRFAAANFACVKRSPLPEVTVVR